MRNVCYHAKGPETVNRGSCSPRNPAEPWERFRQADGGYSMGYVTRWGEAGAPIGAIPGGDNRPTAYPVAARAGGGAAW